MSRPPRHLRQPGPVHPERIETLAGRADPREITLQPGLSLDEAVAGPLRAAGIDSAVLELGNAAFAPMAYVVPAASADAAHVAWFSAPRHRGGRIEIEAASVVLGRRDGAPFVHCHALWRERDGRLGGGHVLPHETTIAAPAPATAWALDGMGFEAREDGETNFKLFHPVPGTASIEAGSRAVVARIRPNEDISQALEAICRRHDLAAAHVAGLGSLVGVRFEDGREVADHATEILILDGAVAPDASGRPRAALDIAVIDMAGEIHRGRLAHGGNPVCITFEVVLVAPVLGQEDSR